MQLMSPELDTGTFLFPLCLSISALGVFPVCLTVVSFYTTVASVPFCVSLSYTFVKLMFKLPISEGFIFLLYHYEFLL